MNRGVIAAIIGCAASIFLFLTAPYAPKSAGAPVKVVKAVQSEIYDLPILRVDFPNEELKMLGQTKWSGDILTYLHDAFSLVREYGLPSEVDKQKLNWQPGISVVNDWKSNLYLDSNSVTVSLQFLQEHGRKFYPLVMAFHHQQLHALLDSEAKLRTPHSVQGILKKEADIAEMQARQMNEICEFIQDEWAASKHGGLSSQNLEPCWKAVQLLQLLRLVYPAFITVQEADYIEREVQYGNKKYQELLAGVSKESWQKFLAAQQVFRSLDVRVVFDHFSRDEVLNAGLVANSLAEEIDPLIRMRLADHGVSLVDVADIHNFITEQNVDLRSLPVEYLDALN